MRNKRPPVVITAGQAGERIEVQPRPGPNELGADWALTGDYRFPLLGEPFWFWRSNRMPEGRRSGKVLICNQHCVTRHHILRRVGVEPQMAVVPTQLTLQTILEEVRQTRACIQACGNYVPRPVTAVTDPVSVPAGYREVSGWTYEDIGETG